MEDEIQKAVMEPSTASQPTNKPQSPLAHQSSETQSDLNNKATSSDIRFEPNRTMASTALGGVSSQATSGTSKPNERLRPNKRKACTDRESPSKRQRSASRPTEAPLGQTRKASAGKERPCKRKRGANKPAEMPLSEAPARNASSETERPSKRRRGDDGVASECSTSKKAEGRSSTVLFGKTRTADFNAKYKQLGKIGGGGFGLVYAGTRTSDQFPVAIKHIHKADVKRRSMVVNGRKCQIPLEVVLMHKAAGEPESVGKSTAVSLLDWYDLGDKVLLVMERPVMSMDLSRYLDISGPLQEALAMVIMKQVVDAAVQMDSEKIFHRDIKSENILLQATSDVPRVRVIDFGCGCILSKRRYRYRTFFGTLIYVPPEFETLGMYEAGPTTVWQLGVLLFEMLHGCSQFNTKGFLGNKCRISGELSQPCQDLLYMCLAVNPEERGFLKQIQQHPWFSLNVPHPTPLPSNNPMIPLQHPQPATPFQLLLPSMPNQPSHPTVPTQHPHPSSPFQPLLLTIPNQPPNPFQRILPAMPPQQLLPPQTQCHDCGHPIMDATFHCVCHCCVRERERIWLNRFHRLWPGPVPWCNTILIPTPYNPNPQATANSPQTQTRSQACGEVSLAEFPCGTKLDKAARHTSDHDISCASDVKERE